MRPTSHSCDAEQSRGLRTACAARKAREGGAHDGARRGDYITNSLFGYSIELTTTRACATHSPILAHLRGRLRRRAEGGAGSGVLRRRLVTAVPREAREPRDPARQALRPGCEEFAALIRRKCRRRKRGPRPKIATVERREASASRWTRAAPRRAAPGTARRAPKRATTEIPRLSALRSPLMGVDGKRKSKTRAQQRAAGTKKTALFDIVNRTIAATRPVPPSA